MRNQKHNDQPHTKKKNASRGGLPGERRRTSITNERSIPLEKSWTIELLLDQLDHARKQFVAIIIGDLEQVVDLFMLLLLCTGVGSWLIGIRNVALLVGRGRFFFMLLLRQDLSNDAVCDGEGGGGGGARGGSPYERP